MTNFTTPLRPHARPSRSTSTFSLTLPFSLTLIAIALVGCQKSPGEVEATSMTEGSDLSEASTQSGTDIEVMQSGPAAWPCQQYLAVSDKTSEHYDEDASGEAEGYVDDFFRAAELEGDAEYRRPDVPLRAALRDACEGQEMTILSDVVREKFVVASPR